jgi:hypothetical protein
MVVLQLMVIVKVLELIESLSIGVFLGRDSCWLFQFEYLMYLFSFLPYHLFLDYPFEVV